MRRVILASQSPRRVHLLKKMGVKFDQIPSNYEEYFDDTRAPDEVAKELGIGKALDVARRHPDAIVIGSDLMIEFEGKQVGKPENEIEAKARLRSLSGKSNQLIASLAVICLNEDYQKVLLDTATVTFKEFTDEFIDAYVATGSVYDKAGGYAIEHPMVKPFIKRIEGRKDTIHGFPTPLVSKLLADFNIPSKQIDDEDFKVSQQELYA